MSTETFAYEHRQIERLAGELRAAGARQDAEGARRRLTDLLLSVLANLTHEAVALRVAEGQCGASEQVYLNSFRRNGEALDAQVRAFGSAWADATVITRDLDRFRMEVDHLLAQLGRRMMEAERKVFPLVEALSPSAAGDTWAPDEPQEHTVRISRDALLAAGIGRG